MGFRRRGFGVLALAAMLAACAARSHRAAQEPFQLDSFQWRADATPQPAIIGRNDWGDLRVRTADRGGLVVSAMIQKIGSTRDELEVRVEERADRVVVKVTPRVAHPRGRIDLTLMVPPGKQLEAATRDGLAEVKYRGDVRVRTRGGAVTLDTPGHASARSETGSITARLSGEVWQRPMSFASGSGDIILWLPHDANLVVGATTAGAIEMGFAHPARGGRQPARLEMRLGAGGPPLRIKSVSGDVRVMSYHAARGRTPSASGLAGSRGPGPRPRPAWDTGPPQRSPR